MQLVQALSEARIDVPLYQRRVLELFAGAALRTVLSDWIERALSERCDQVLARRSFAERDYTLQLLYLAPQEIHPPHCHHNVTSTQVLLHGTGALREYDRVARIDPQRIRLLPVGDRPMREGDVIQSSEFVRNAHWFGANDKAGVMLNFNVRGYEPVTFDAAARLGRRLLDPTRADSDGVHVSATELDVAAAYDKFASQPLQDFPLPVPLTKPAAAVRVDLG